MIGFLISLMWYSHLVKLDKYKVHLAILSGNVVKKDYFGNF